MPETIIYNHDGEELHGLLERPERPNGRAIMLVHEISGIGANVRQRARQLVGLGYTAFAADLYGGGKSYAGDEASARMEALTADLATFRGRVRAGLDIISGELGFAANRTAAFGYCFGGRAVLELARSGAELAAVVSFHGLLFAPEPAPPGAIRTSILACTGARDPLVPLADVAAFQEEMHAAGADWQLIAYGRAHHAFTNPNVMGIGDKRLVYDPSADRQSWAAALLFLDEAMGGG